MDNTSIFKLRKDFDSISRDELRLLVAELDSHETQNLENCVQFFMAETKGLWHNRARAAISRRLKHYDLGRTHRTELVNIITNRLQKGTFTEQFKDQLRLALYIDKEKTLAICRQCSTSTKPHIRRYADWALNCASKD